MTTVLVTLLAVVVALLVVLVAGLLRSQARIVRALGRLGIDLTSSAGSVAGSAALRSALDRDPHPTDVAGTTPEGDAVRVAVTGGPRPTLLMFLTSSCTDCRRFWDTFAAASRLSIPGDARLVVVTKGEDAESRTRLRRLAPPDVVVVMSTTAWDDYDVAVAPHFLFLDGSGRVVTRGDAATWDDVVSACDTPAGLA